MARGMETGMPNTLPSRVYRGWPASTTLALAVVPPTSRHTTRSSPYWRAYHAAACVPKTGPDSIVSTALVLPTRATPPLVWPTSRAPVQPSS